MKIRYVAGIAVIASLGLGVSYTEAQQINQQTSGTAATLTINPSTVREIQQRLNQRGYNSGPVDGNWGIQSQRAMKSFQQAQGLQGTGKIDLQTLTALGIGLNGAQNPQTQTVTNEPRHNGANVFARPSTIRQVQQDLNRRGFGAGNVDGVLGPETQQALRNFQQTQGLETTGRLNQQTLSALGISNSGSR